MLISVFNADDHPMLRKGISDLITEDSTLQWVGSAANGTEAMEKIRVIQPDVALLDIEMPGATGIEVAETLIAEKVPTRFILLTLFNSRKFLLNSLKIGALGYLPKESTAAEITSCIHAVAAGRPYVHSSLTHHLLASGPEADLLSELSDHEVNILRLIARQKTTAEIADMLFISPKTVANHRHNISKKLRLDGRQNGLLKWAVENRELLE